MRLPLLITLLFFPAGFLFSQQFLNGDLEGEITGISSLPRHWHNVPFNDPVCGASATGQDSPDLTDPDGPNRAVGISGVPYSGKTFVSGVFSDCGGMHFHEGIMQEIPTFIPGHFYEIDFYQAVVKQSNCIDTSGCWMVYADTTLIGISKCSVSHLEYKDNNIAWERRSIVFKATRQNHTIKFLPGDDDDSQVCNESDEGGALRMGIDMISLVLQLPAEIEVTANPVNGFVSIHNSSKSAVDFELRSADNKSVLLKKTLDKGLNEIDLTAQPGDSYVLQFVIEEKTYMLSYEKN